LLRVYTKLLSQEALFLAQNASHTVWQPCSLWTLWESSSTPKETP